MYSVSDEYTHGEILIFCCHFWPCPWEVGSAWACRNGGIGGGSSEHLNDENGMGVSGLSFARTWSW